MQKTKESRIKKEQKRLSKIFVSRSEKEREAIEALVKRAAYMRVTLEDMEADLDENGFVEMFTQSDKLEPYERERPVARLYNSMNKNFQNIMKQLTEFVEKTPPREGIESDGFDEFVNARE